MKIAVCLVVVLIGATATPSGYYHQQYNYKTSSSSYKNNELQHKTDDQGYYSKDGDLEGKAKPKVSSNSEHSEYVNPKLQQDRLNTGYIDAETDLSSHGNVLANTYGTSIGGGGYQAGSHYGSDLYSEGLASSDHIGGAASMFGSRSSATSQSSYGSSNLRSIASRLENDLQQEIQEAVRSRSGYSHQTDISDLESELHRNLTARLNELLQEQYGTQTIRGGQSYSLTGGRLHTLPNYEQIDLENLQRRIENSLLQQLRYDSNHRASHSTNQQVYNENYARYESTTYRPTTYRPIYPNLNVINTQRPFPEYPGSSKDSYYSQNGYNRDRISSNVQYTSVPHPLSVTTIASRVQSQLDSQLNRVLEQAQTQYFSENYGYSTNNLNVILERLRQELKNNLTYALDEQLRSQYGTQVQKDNYMFSVGSSGEIGSQYNYNVADLESLKRQVENNLLTKLNRDFESAKQRWISRQQLQQNNYEQSQSSDYRYGSSLNNQRLDYSTPRNRDDDYYRATAASIVPRISTGIKGNQYLTTSGSHQSNYGSSASGGNVIELQRQLQSDLSQQVQSAISQNQAYINRYSTHGENGRSFEEAYQRLYDDLQRNLTQQLNEFVSGGSGYSNFEGSVSDAQLASLKSQLQRSLASQLQSGLQQSYSASASYSASSGSSSSSGTGAYTSGSSGSYRAARGSQTSDSGYGDYRSGGGYLLDGEDCQGDNHNSYPNHRTKRSYGYRSRPLGLSTHSGTAYESSSRNEGYSTGFNRNFGGYGSGDYSERSTLNGQQLSPLREQDNPEAVQQLEPVDEFIGQQEIDMGQTTDDSDDFQQLETDHDFENINLESQNKLQTSGRERIGQETHSFKVERGSIENFQNKNHFSESNRKPSVQHTGIVYGKLELGSQGNVGQQVDKSDLSQQEFVGSGYFKPNPSFANLESEGLIGQDVDDSELTQQVEDFNFKGPYPKQNKKQLDLESDTRTIEMASNILSNSNNVASQIQVTTEKSLIRQIKPEPVGQQIDDTDIFQQSSQPSDSGTLGFGPLFQGSSKNPLVTEDYSFNSTWQSNKDIQANSLYKPVNQETDFQYVAHNNSFSKSVSSKDNNQRTANSQYDADLNYTPSAYLLSKPNLPFEVKELFQQLETNLTDQLKSTIKNDISYSKGPNQLYLDILRKWQKYVDVQSEQLLKHHSNYVKVDQINLNQFKEYLKTSLETKIQKELLNYGFSQETFINSSSGNNHQLEINNQNAESLFHYNGDQRNQANLIRYSPKPVFSPNYSQRENNLQIDTYTRKPYFVNPNPYLLSTHSQISENNRQLYGEQSATHYISPTRDTYSQIGPWSIGVNYSDYLTETNKLKNITINSLSKFQQNVEGGSRSSSDMSKILEHSMTSLENITPEGQAKLEISYPDKVLLIQTPESSLSEVQPLFPPNNQEVNYDINLPIKPSQTQSYLPTTSNPLNLNNFPTLPTPELSAPIIPAIEPQPDTPRRQPNFSQTNVNIEAGPRHEQSIIEAEQEGDILIEKLRKAQQNRPTYVNMDSHTNTDQTHYGGRTYYHSTTVRNLPSQFNIVQVKLQNITPKQLKIINQIEEEFTRIIDDAVQHQIKKPISHPELFLKLERELKINLTNYVEGNAHIQLEADDVDLNKYSKLVQQNFEEKIIPDLNKYLEIKLLKRVREQLNKAYEVGNEDAYTFQHSPRRPYENTHYPSLVDYEILQVQLENLSPDQLKSISQMEDGFSKQIEVAIQTHMASVTSRYLSSFEKYQTSFNELQTQLRNNISECIQVIKEPGLSQYSQIVENFDPSKIEKLEKILEFKLIKVLKERLKAYFNSDLTGSNSLHHDLKTDPLNYNHKKHNLESSSKNGIQFGYTNTLNSEFDETVEPTTEKAGWWQRFESKVKQGATNLKNKIVGSS